MTQDSGKPGRVEKSEEEWRRELEPRVFAVCRRGATEPPFSGELLANKADGTYVCAACGRDLFLSDSKYESGSGWPSFFQTVDNNAVSERPDHSHGMERIEILCGACDSHLGHVFPDGPAPTGMRYCVNSLSLGFRSKD